MKKGLLYLFVGAALAVYMFAEDGRACEYNKCSSISIGYLVSDDMPASGDIHAFTVSVTADDILLIRANRTSGAIDPQITLLHPSGFVIATAGALGTGRAEMLTPELTLTETYTILIRDITGERGGGYNLAVQSIIRPVNAVTLPYDGYRRDSLEMFSQMNTYRFTAVEGDMVSIEMIAVAPQLTPSIRLFAPSGKMIASDVDANFALIPNIVIPSGGQYVIIASDDLGDETGAYFLVLLRSVTDVNENGNTVPTDFSVEQNHPNPFNPQTTIGYSLPRSAAVTIDIYNLLGERIRALVSQTMPPGKHGVVWDGRDDDGGEVSSGVYFYRLRADDFSATKKMLLLR